MKAIGENIRRHENRNLYLVVRRGGKLKVKSLRTNDLKNYHFFRHYFASRCLLAGLTVQEVADLLGHSDNGQLVLRTYGHLCHEHLHKALANLRLVS